MSKSIISIAFSILVVASVVMARETAQTGSKVATPVLSFIVDSANGVRPVIGVLGSASVAGPLNLGFEVLQAAVPTEHDYILATTRESNWPLLLILRGGTISVLPIGIQEVECEQLDEPLLHWERKPRRPCPQQSLPSATTKIDRVALSPTGTSAAFVSESERRVYAYTNMSVSPTFAGRFELGSLGALSAIGISDSGGSIVVGVSDGDSGALFLLSPYQLPRLLAPMRRPSAIRFLRKSDDVVVADDLDNKIYVVSNGQPFVIATADDGISTPVGIALSNDNQRVFAGNAGSATISIIGLSGSGVKSLNCNCNLTGLHSTNTDSVFRLTDFSGGSILFFDGTTDPPRVMLVPMGGQ